MTNRDSTGLDVTADEVRCLSVITNRKASGQLDFFVTGIGVDTHLHGFLDPDGERFDFGARLKDRGEHAGTVRIRGSSEAVEGEIGRLSVEPGAEECELAVTHNSSALTADPLPTDRDAHRQRLSLAGGASEGGEYELRWSTVEPSTGADCASARLFGGNHPVWLQARRVESESTGG